MTVHLEAKAIPILPFFADSIGTLVGCPTPCYYSPWIPLGNTKAVNGEHLLFIVSRCSVWFPGQFLFISKHVQCMEHIVVFIIFRIV